MRKFLSYLAPAFALVCPVITSAHEVYVLTPQEISQGLQTPAFNMADVALGDFNRFLFWGFVTFLVISTVFCISIFRVLERALDPFFFRIKKYAPAMCRMTVGVGLLAGAYYQASYGPELPLGPVYGALTPIVTALIAISGVLMLAGMYVRVASTVALFFFSIAVVRNGVYMLTYANYFGEFVVLLLLGAHSTRRGARTAMTGFWHRIERAFAPYAFALIRVCFGISLFYAAFYAKILHNDLALQVATLPLAGHQYGVAHYLGFEPHFLVVGAALIELIIATFFIFGIEIRWTSIFLLFWLSLSLWWFGESVWPHIILIGIPIAFFMHGYDNFSAEGYFFKRGKREPVL